ncbi:MAG: LytTR family DNA-binding domain-containing protein [Oscillospiraceae bacterium]|nr:LytTR family DNA-binding domain-containing protein [Oscillospiraceae bacterium]
MRIVICEDEEPIQTQISDAIHDWAKERSVHVEISCFASAEAFLMVWENGIYDLAILDIELKELTGIDLATIIRKTDKSIQLLFLTSHKQYSLSGYDVDALHYLIKPLSVTAFIPILEKALSLMGTRFTPGLFISNDSITTTIPYIHIHYIEKQSHFAYIHTEYETISIRKTITELLDELPADSFILCHRSYIVNLLKIDCIYSDHLLLSSGIKIPLSRNNVKPVKNAYVRLYTS